MNKTIIFVSNYSDSLNNTMNSIAENLSKDLEYKILTYRKMKIENSYSYEEYLEKNYEILIKMDDIEFGDKYKNINLMLSFVVERMLTNFSYGTYKLFGMEKYTDKELLFFLKSYTLFLSKYIKKSSLVFSGFSDNFVSLLSYFIAKHYNKLWLSFDGYFIINYDDCYLIDSPYKTIYKNYLTNKDKPNNIIKYIENIKKYNVNNHIKEEAKKTKNLDMAIFGVLSTNMFKLNYIKFCLYGYRSSKKIRKFMNIDKPPCLKKIKANLKRIINKILVKLYLYKIGYFPKKGEKYIYFPLQLQPEASTISVTPFYSNQLAVIENIIKSLPIGYTLLVKEHPAAIGIRELWFYKHIRTLPFVKIVNMQVNGKELIKMSDVIVGYGGTTLVETIILGKKMILFSKEYSYINIPLIETVENPKDVYFKIRKLLDVKLTDKELNNEIERMLMFFYQKAYSLHEGFYKKTATILESILKEK